MTDPRPSVSVVIPTYERAEYLRVALESVLAQTFTDFEVTVHDNASPTDPTPLVTSYGDPRVRVRRNRHNVGLFRNIVLAGAAARGKYIATLHDDDAWKPNFLARMVGALEADPSLTTAFCDHDIIDSAGKVDEAETCATSRRFGRAALSEGVHRPFFRLALIERAICSSSAAVFRATAIDWGAIPAEVGMGIDLYVSYLVSRGGGGCYYTPDRLAQYRVHPASTTSGKRDLQRRLENSRNAMFYWDIFAHDPALVTLRPYFEMKRGLNELVIVSCFARQGRLGAAFAELASGIRHARFGLSTLFSYAAYATRLRRITA
jgi:glycosyltransferase involved in cell wall biosynthesis